MATRLDKLWKSLFLKSLEKLERGYLEIGCAGGGFCFGDPEDPLRALIQVNDEDFFRAAVLGGDIGIGESYMRGEWSTADLVSVVRLGVRNIDALESGNALLGFFRRAADFLAHRHNGNSEAGSLRNIAYHYDLGNDFYGLFLDRNLVYSCAVFETLGEELESAQLRKFDRICRKLSLQPGDRVLEIGAGWGGFALYAAKKYGCKVTTTTISQQQHSYCQRSFSASANGAEIELLSLDYRRLLGEYDKIVSIEMFEAVGFDHYDEFFGACDRLLTPGGSMLIQTITMPEARFDRYRQQSDWIKKYIFPGAELASVLEIQQSLKRVTKMQLFHLEDIGWHYALTVSHWRQRFRDNLDAARRLGFDDVFTRMWDYYLAYCEAAFVEGYISDAQLLLRKRGIGETRPQPLSVHTSHPALA